MRLPAHSAVARPDAAASRPSLPLTKALARVGARLQADEGFTIIEVIVATLVLVVGLLTAFLALNVAVKSSAAVRGREEGITLARQVTEDARAIPYSQLSSSSLTTTLQGFNGLANQGTGSSWQIKRGGFTYTITPTLTPIYDKKDAANATSNTSVDAQEVTTLVQWTTFQGQTHSYTESTIMTKAGQDPGLAVSNLAIASPPSGTGGLSGSATAGYTISASIPSLTFSVTAPSGTQAIDWRLNGALQSSWAGSTPSSGTTWTSSAWNISSFYDSTYTIGAQAVDASGVDGPEVTIQVRLIRNVPSAPSLTYDGYNTNLLSSTGGTPGTGAELVWSSNPEPNVVGYDIYNSSLSTLLCQTGTSTSYSGCSSGSGNFWCLSATDCIDLGANNAGNSTSYKLVALYYDANNTLRTGAATSITIPAGTPTAPNSPASLTVATQLDETAILTWPVSVGGASVAFYRVYRDGDNYSSRYATVAASSCSLTCTYHDYSRQEGHSYYVTAVTSGLQESYPPTGPVGG
jgi:Tfp pilus assembly protein PilV